MNQWPLKYLFLTIAMSSAMDTTENLQQILKSFEQNQSILFITPLLPIVLNTTHLIAPVEDFTQPFIEFFISRVKVIIKNDIKTPPLYEFTVTGKRRLEKSLVVFLTKKQALERTKHLIESDYWRSNAKILVVINEADRDLIFQILKNLFRQRKAINATILTVNDFAFYTWFPYNNEILVKLEENDDIFPVKIPKDFNQFLLTAAVTEAEPYVLKPDKPNLYVDGVEVRALKTIAAHLNFSLEYKTAEHPWVYLDSNKTISGLFGLLHRREADILFHGVQRSYERFQLGDALMSHYEDSVNWIMPLMQPEDSYDIIFQSFNTDMWIMVGVVLLTMAGVLLIFSEVQVTFREIRKSTLSDSFFSAIALNLYIGIKVPPFTAQRILMTFFYLYIINTTLAYQSLLYNIYTKPNEAKQLETFREAVDFGLNAYLYPSGRPSYNITEQEIWKVVLQPDRHVFTDNYANSLKLIHENKTVFAQLIKNTALYEISKNHLDGAKRPLIHIVNKRVLPFAPTFFMCRGHPLKEMFEVIVMQIMESGIIQNWLNELMVLGKAAVANGPKPLNITQTAAVFLLLASLLGFALLIFICELCVKKISRTKKVV